MQYPKLKVAVSFSTRVIAAVLVLLSFHHPAGAVMEQYGFDSWLEGWAPTTNASMLAITNVIQSPSTNASWFGEGAQCLRVECNIRTNANQNSGRVQVDLRQYLGFTIPVPTDLSNQWVRYNMIWPTGGDAARGTNRYRWFAMDENGKYQYYGQFLTPTQWVNIGTNGAYTDSAFLVAPTNGTEDAGFNAAKIVMLGMDVATGVGSTGVYQGPIFLEKIRFDAPPALFVAPTNQKYSFDSSAEGFGIQTWWDSQAITNVYRSTTAPSNRSGALAMDVHLNWNTTNFTKGEVFVDLEWNKPTNMPAMNFPVDLDGKVVSAWVYCPAGLRGPETNRNSIQLFCKDTSWRTYYGTPEHIVTGYWMRVAMTPGTNQAYQGWSSSGFDASKIRLIGLKVSTASGGDATYDGVMYMDGLAFSVPDEPLPPITNSQHYYDMETEYQANWWKFDTNPEGWHAKSWTDVYYATNEGYNGSVALAADATFATNDSYEVVTNEYGQVITNEYVYQKGVFEIAYQPALNLSTKDHRKIHARLRFDPAVTDPNGFDASVNVFDKITDQWYTKNFKVGGSSWNLLDFDLDDTDEYDAGSPVPMNTEQIGFLVIQIFGNSDWSGTIYLDDVAVGGRETQTNYSLITSGFVQAAGHKFVLDGSNFYHCGANIEYLQTVPSYTVRECLDWAASNHIGVVRTWAMQEGRPYSFQPERGVWNEVMFEHLDRIVAEAGHRGIRLMLATVDNWAHNGGVFQYVHWAKREHPESVNTNLNPEGVLYHDQFWTNAYCKQWYKDYVAKLLTRTNTITGRVYKDDPTIFAWEVVNEPRCESDFGGRTIHNWLHDITAYFRTFTTNHMLSNGQEGGYVNTYEFADTIPWEVYPDNYYHYAVYATGNSECDLYGCGRGHGVDFLSDNRSESTYVQWQDGFYTNQGPTNAEWRTGMSNVNFCTARIYIDQKEYNVWRTNYNGADQRLEWINDHWYDSHAVIGKPMILEEFGIHGIGWVFNGSYGQVQLTRTPEYTFEDRVGVYELFYRHIENSGIPAGYFWNFGFDGMWDDPFHLCEFVDPWLASSTNSAATAVAVSTNHVQQGEYGLKLSWNASAGQSAIFNCPTNEKWVLRVDEASTNDPPTHGINRTKFFWSFYNPAAQDVKVSLSLVGRPEAYWCETPAYTLTQGWNRIMFDLSSGAWQWTSNGVVRTNYLINIPQDYVPGVTSNVLENVREVGLVFKNLPAGAGEIYIDNVQIKRDDGFVVYADDPLNPVIKAHGLLMKSRNVATNDPANHLPVAANFTVVAHPEDPTPFTLAGSDEDGDFLSYRIIQKPTNGWVFGTPPSNMVYRPKVGAAGRDTFTYVIHDGKTDSAEIEVTVQQASFDEVRYDFETDEQGWYANYTEWTGYAVTAVVQATEMAFHRSGSLRAEVDLRSGLHDAGDAEVNMESDPPPHVIGPVNLNGQTISISVFCPAGARGDESNPNRIQIYVKDTSWRAEYTAEVNIEEDRWVTYTMTVSTNTPPGGWKADDFDPTQIRAVGVRVKHGGEGSDYLGPIYMDPVCFPILGRVLYGFDQDTQDWTTEDWSDGDASLSWTNIGHPAPGALVVMPGDGTSYGKFYIKDWDLVDNQDLFYNHLIQCSVYVPADAPVNIHHAVRVRLLVRSSADGWAYAHISQEVILVPGQWNVIQWDVSSLPYDVLRDVDEFGMEIVWPNRDVWAGPVYVDSIQILPGMPSAEPAIVSVTAATNTVGRYQRYEITVGVDHVTRLNPYDPANVDLRAVFTSPNGTNWTVNGFYMEEAGDVYGSGRFNVRFAPAEVGVWTYEVIISNSQGSDSSTGHSFTCVASDRSGWIRVSDDNPHYFEHHDDSPFIGKGYCHPWDGDDEGIFAAAAEHGVNMIHWWMAPWDTLLTVKPGNPDEWWREKSTYDTYEQGRAAELDRVVGHAEKHGVKLVFTIWPHDAIRDFNHHKWRLNGSWAPCNKDNSIGMTNKISEPEWYYNAFSDLDDPPQNQKFFYDARYKEYQNRLYRYIIARWGYSEAIGTWALVSELFGTFANSASAVRYQDPPAGVTQPGDFDGRDPFLNMPTNSVVDGNDYSISWLEYINDYFKDNDPFGHPTTASYGTDEYWEHGFPIVDVPQIHTYSDLYNWITPPTTLNKYHRYLRQHYNKPSFMGEIGTVDWKHFEPEYLRVTAWPGLLTGGAITPMMWNTPAFSWFGDAKMGPWLDEMADEMRILSEFVADIEFHKLGLGHADAEARLAGEPAAQVISTFESDTDGWTIFADGTSITGITAIARSDEHASEGSHSLRMDVDIDEWRFVGSPFTGVELKNVSWDWSDFWPGGTLKMDLYIPEAYHPDDNTNGFLLGINKDPRSIIEVWTYDGTNYAGYSTTNEYKADGGWKKLTVGMQWNLEFHLKDIPTLNQASQITGIKLYFGDVGILRGPVWLDNVTAGRYAFSTVGMISTNRDFAFAWIQDRMWTNIAATGAVFQLNGLLAGDYHVEWWNTLTGEITTLNAGAPTGTLLVAIPDFTKDIAVKVRRAGGTGATVHNVAVADIVEPDWVIRALYQPVYVLAANRGTASETFSVTLTDTTSGQVIGTNTLTIGAGESEYTRFIWNTMNGPFGTNHQLVATASTVAGETITADNTLSGRIKVFETTPPWDQANALRRWREEAGSSDGRTLTVSTNFASEGSESLCFYHRSPDKGQAYFGFDNVYEDWSNRVSFVMDVYVADDSTNAQLLMRTGEDWTWYYSEPMAITSGWNYDVTFSFTESNWTRAVSGEDPEPDVVPGGMEEVQQIFIKFTGYTDEGYLYVDNMRLDGLYKLHIAYYDGLDLFPQAIAEQSNYTGAACAWMIARYLGGPSFSKTQSQIHGEIAHDPAHNGEITPQACASWMLTNVPAGYWFGARTTSNLTDAVKEAAYWVDFIPPAGLQSPAYILSGTNWSYHVVRGFYSSAKPYDGGYGVTSNNRFTVYGLWLNDPRVGGLGYNLYATASDMTNIYLPSLSDGRYYLVAEPPADEEEMAIAEMRLAGMEVELASADPNPSMASYLAARFGGGAQKARLEGGDPELYESVPLALREDSGFMEAFNAGPVVSYYAVNTNRDDTYYLAAGGVRGPTTTRFILKLAPDGSLLQATWTDNPMFFEPLPFNAADWVARNGIEGGETADLVSNQLVFAQGGSAFKPEWELVYDVDGDPVFSLVRYDTDLSGDTDGDGSSDRNELYTGTDPDSSLSVFYAQGGTLKSLGNDKLLVQWPGLSGRTYRIHRTEQLDEPFTPIASGIPGVEPMNTYTDTVTSATMYYRVEVE